jgi:hypothetical protein
MANQDSQNQPFWQSQLNDWTKTKGLENYLGTGLQDSTVGKSGFFDQATQQGAALRAQALQQAQNIIGNAPVTGISPTAGAQQLQAASAQQAQQGRAGIGTAVQGAANNAQSTQDWINQLMGSQSQAINAQNQNWQNYQQAMLQGATNAAASQNASQGSMMQTGGAVAGAAALAAGVAI